MNRTLQSYSVLFEFVIFCEDHSPWRCTQDTAIAITHNLKKRYIKICVLLAVFVGWGEFSNVVKSVLHLCNPSQVKRTPRSQQLISQLQEYLVRRTEEYVTS